MPLNSMTGFARSQGANDFCTWVWEAKSVNAKGLDARLRLPSGFEALEAEFHKRVKTLFSRGNISLSLNLNWKRPNSAHHVNMDTVERLLELLPEIQARSPAIAPATMDGLLAVKGVIEWIEAPLDDDDQSALHKEFLLALDEVLGALADNRTKEGGQLMNVLTTQLATIDKLSVQAEAQTSMQPAAIKARLVDQVRELIDMLPALPEDRLAQEAAIMMLKADVREELDRLKAHIVAARELLAQDGAIGRQFDFLCQEFNREANTLCSKSADVELTRIGLALKSVIDQMREQVQNVE